MNMATAIKTAAGLARRQSGPHGWTASWSARTRPPGALRELDQEAVDRIVWAMTVAGLENAVELAELAMEETQFGVLEDKVIKNYIATEFLYDYLKDKKSVGVIDEDRERALQYVAEPIGVVLALLPITNPTSTTLFKSIVVREDAQRADHASVGRAPLRCATPRRGAPPGGGRGRWASAQRAPGDPGPVARGLPVPLPSPRRRLHLDDRRARRRWRPRTPPASRASASDSGNAPVYVHRSADIRMAVVDILVSKTFDSSVICPAEQTCVIDEQIYDPMIDEFQRMGARLLTDEETRRAGAARRSPTTARCSSTSSGSPASTSAAWPASRSTDGDKVLLAPLPTDLDALAAHPFIAEKLMPVLGCRALAVGRARDPGPASWSPSTAAWATPRPCMRPTTT